MDVLCEGMVSDILFMQRLLYGRVIAITGILPKLVMQTAVYE